MQSPDALPYVKESPSAVLHAALTADLAVETRPSLDSLLAEARREYVGASPWPHAVLQGLFDDDLVRQAEHECLSIDPADMFVTSGRNQIKEEISTLPGPASSQLLAQMHDPEFVAFLEAVTGIPDLIADTTFEWAGVHRAPRGGFTMIHRDFREHSKTHLHHRVNVLLYLNREWPLEYGSALELWPSDMRAASKSIRPLANTTVIFETHDQTLHGFPDPVACPTGGARVSLACYYYTSAPRAEKVRLRRGIWARRAQDSILIGRRGVASTLGDFAPTPIKPTARRVLEWFRTLRGVQRP